MTGILIALAVLFSVFGGASYYVAHRIHQGLVSFFPNLRFWPVLVVFLVLALVMILGFGQSMLPFSAGIKHILGFISSCYMGIFIYLLLFTAVFRYMNHDPEKLNNCFRAMLEKNWNWKQKTPDGDTPVTWMQKWNEGYPSTLQLFAGKSDI